MALAFCFASLTLRCYDDGPPPCSQIQEKLLSSEATNISLQQGSASLQLEHNALQEKYKGLSEEQQATQQQLRATQVRTSWHSYAVNAWQARR